MKEVILNLIGMCMVVFGWIFSLWLGLYVMLYGGILTAIQQWGVNDSAVVWGIIRAIFFECSFLIGWACSVIGVLILHAANHTSSRRCRGLRR